MLKYTSLILLIAMATILGCADAFNGNWETRSGKAVGANHHDFVDLEDVEFGGNVGIRQRRVTCDLLSPEIKIKGFGGKVNHGACAANCLSMGKAGGRCNNGIFQCRKTNFKDLWDKRFG